MDCGISHNPISNLRLGCKIADITKYTKHGINVALGTDGQGSGNNLDMFESNENCRHWHKEEYMKTKKELAQKI